LSGLRIERSERRQHSINDLSDAELVKIARGENCTVELDSNDWTSRTAIGRKQ
jgi:hypothetical protein